MSAGYVRHSIAETVHPDVIFTELVAGRDGGFWLDDALGQTISYLGVGTRCNERGVDGFATDDPFPVARVGWLSYAERASTLGVEIADDNQTRSAVLDVRAAVEIDHRAGTVSVIGRTDADAAELAAAARVLAGRVPGPVATPPARTALWRDEPDQYGRAISECLHHIRDGDAYQICLTTAIEVPGTIDAAETYRALRSVAPTRHGAYLCIGPVALLSASPETFLTVRGRTASTSPIKGTRPRSVDPAEDVVLRRELSESDKERAENLMIVDLCRNDLARVCDPATVTVDALLAIETYSTVHQLVSTVSGELAPGATAVDVARSLFPAGSMTGAPKRRAVEILDGLESGERGLYSGAFGYAGAGDLTLAMTIRSIVIDDAGARIGVGGGITSGSVVADEITEVGVKAHALLGVLGATPNPYLYTE